VLPLQQTEVPEIPNVDNLRAGSKGRNFESFTGTLYENEEEKQNDEGKKVLVKLYKRQQAKIDEAEN
jgi:hypothetical protein